MAKGRLAQFSHVLLAISLIPLLFPPAPAAQEPAGHAGLACENGVELTVHGGALRQGSLRLLGFRSTEPLNKVQVAWATQQLYFWRDPADPSRHFALIAADLTLEPELSRLSLTALTVAGELFVCTQRVAVGPGEFLTDRLRVKPGFVELSKKDLERAERESESLQEIWATVTPERFWDGPFLPPLKQMQPRGNFGRRRLFNDEPRSPHTGEDLRGASGTPVYAPQRGRVVLAQNLFFAGNAVILDHGLGLYTLYAHLSAFSVKEGDVVEPGHRLGRVGATGRVTGPHLHWSARLGEARFNPLELLSLEIPGPPEENPEPSSDLGSLEP